MAKLTLDTIAKYDEISKINSNFDKIEAELQNKVLYRNNPVGEPNTIEGDVDINNKNIFNVNEIRASDLLIDGVNITTSVVTSQTAAAASATAAASSAASASSSASAAATSASQAAAAADFIPEIANYAALRAYSGPITEFHLKGHTSVLDGGAGIFRVDVSDTISADNGGAILVDAVGRRWKRDPVDNLSTKHFGVDSTGVTNCTTALLAFYNACISTGNRGRICAGTYKVTTGVLVFDCNQANKAFPIIETDGHDLVFFTIDAATATNAPVLKWTNGTALSSSTYQWLGGEHGGFTVTDSTGATAPLRSAISLQGVKGLKLGRIVGNTLRGDVITVPQALFGGSNPDPYAVSSLTYDFIEAYNCAGWAINNQNFVGQDSWQGNGVYVVGGAGGIFGSGSGNDFGELIVAHCSGYGYDDGTFASAVGGPPQRNTVTVAEMDNVKYPFRFNKTSNTTFGMLRIIHRYNVAPNASGLYWPLIGIDLAGGATPSITNLSLQVFHRIEGGGVLGQLGTFLTGNNNGNIGGLIVDVDYADNGTLGVTDSLMFTGLPNNITGFVHRKSKPLFDLRDKAISSARGSASTQIVNSGFGTAAAKVAFPTQQFSTYSAPYNTTTYTFTAPRRGLYLLQASIALTVAVGTRIRLGFLASSYGMTGVSYQYQANAGSQVYKTSIMVPLVAGETVFVIADQNTAGTVNCTPTSSTDEVSFTVAEI